MDTDDDLDARELIIGLRGGVPATCDFCGEKRAPETLHPEEAGDWVCEKCMKRWQAKEKE